MAQKTDFTRRDIAVICACVTITILLTMGKGSADQVLMEMLKHLWAYAVYSLATVLIIVGLTKKMFKYQPNRVQIARWAAMLAAFAAVSQFLQELFMALTGTKIP